MIRFATANTACEALPPRHSFTPRGMRRKGSTIKNGTGQKEKSILMAAAKKLSDRWIYQSYDTLVKAGERYQKYRRQFTGDKVRKSK